jgi:hypothetical protein
VIRASRPTFAGERDPTVELLQRRRPQQLLLLAEPEPDADPLPVQDPFLLGEVDLRAALVELVKAGNLGDRDQVGAAEPPALVLDAALLVRTVLTRDAVERLEPVVRAERHPPLGLDTAATEADPIDRRLEVVVADVAGRDTAQRAEGLDVALQERLLGLGLEHPVHRLARVGHPAT